MYSADKLNKQGDNIYSLDVLLLLFGTSLLFYVQFLERVETDNCCISIDHCYISIAVNQIS